MDHVSAQDQQGDRRPSAVRSAELARLLPGPAARRHRHRRRRSSSSWRSSARTATTTSPRPRRAAPARPRRPRDAGPVDDEEDGDAVRPRPQAPSDVLDAGTTSPASPTGRAPRRRCQGRRAQPVGAGRLGAAGGRPAARAPAGQIGRVDDFHGNVSTTTVYWLTPDQQPAGPADRAVPRRAAGACEGFDTLVDGRVSVDPRRQAD